MSDSPIIHVEAQSIGVDGNDDPDWEQDGPTIIVAACGARATIVDDDEPIDPPDFDFVDRSWPQKGTCEACRAALEGR